MATPFITLTANLQSILGDAELSGAAIMITLCGYGQTIPVVPGQGVLADAGVPQVIAQSGSTSISVELFSNYQITPAGTFYEIAVIDENENVIQSGTYQFENQSAATIDLSSATQIVQPVLSPPVGVQTGVLFNISGVTTNINLPGTPRTGTIVQVYYNGVFQMPGVNVTIAGGSITTIGYSMQAGDKVYVVYYQ